MGKEKKIPNKDDWRNSTEPYTIELTRSNAILDDKILLRHIDFETYNYKPWPELKLKEVSRNSNTLELINSSGNIKYLLKITVEENKLHVCCSCDRRIELLCHHAFHALLHIIKEYGIFYFQQIK